MEPLASPSELPPLFAPAPADARKEMRLSAVLAYVAEAQPASPACLVLRYAHTRESQRPGCPFHTFELLAVVDEAGRETLTAPGGHFERTTSVSYSGARANYLQRVYGKRVFALTGVRREEKVNEEGEPYVDHSYKAMTVNPAQAGYFLEHYNERLVPGDGELLTFSALPSAPRGKRRASK